MKFETIKNSQSHTGYAIPDCEFQGQKNGLLTGWSFEFTDAQGCYHYSDVQYIYGTPEQHWESDDSGYMRWLADYKDWQPTGKVIFRGYYREFYDTDIREWCVEKVDA